MAFDATKAADRWAQNLGGSTEKIKEKINALTQSPTAKAAANRDKYLSGVQAGADKWAANLSAVSLSEWQNAFINKGLPRISSGAAAAKPKMVNFLTQLSSYQDANLPAINSRKVMTLEDAITKSADWIRVMSKFKPTKR